MAKQTGPIPFTGTIGNMIGYKVNGEHYIRSKPENVHQSPATRAAARLFGQASTLSCAMRHAISSGLDLLAEGDMGNRLNTRLLQVLHADDLHRTKRFTRANFRSLNGFSFSTHAGLAGTLGVTPEVTRCYGGGLEVTVPAMQNFEANPAATHIQLRAMAIAVQPGFKTAKAVSSARILIPCGQPSETTTLTLPACTGEVCCVVLEVVSCIIEKGEVLQLQNRQYNAAEIIAVLRMRETTPEQHHNSPLPWELMVPLREVDGAGFVQRE